MILENISILTVSIIGLLGYIYILLLISSEMRISKKELWENISIAILNGADVVVLNDIIQNQKRVKKVFNRNLKYDYYHNLVQLSEVLEDLRSNEYIKEEKIDNDYINKINVLIEEDKKKSPFDGLEEKQKDFFENVVNILDEENFSKIQTNLNKISNELALKSEEAKKAKLNFKIAIISIAITIVVGVYQIYDSSITKQEVFNQFYKLNHTIETNESNLTKQRSQ